MVIGGISTYGTYVSVITAPTVGGVIGVVISVGTGVWGALRYFGVID